MRDDQYVQELRRRHRALEEKISRLKADPGRTPAWKHDEENRLRADAAAEARRLTSGVMLEIAQRRANMRTGLPGEADDAVETVLSGLQTIGIHPAMPLESLAQMSQTDLEGLTARAAATERDAVTVAAVRSVLARRAEQGDARAEQLGFSVNRRLGELVRDLPSVQQRREEFTRLGTIEARIGDTINAIERGGPDEGIHAEFIADLSARRARGELTSDDVRNALQQPPRA